MPQTAIDRLVSIAGPPLGNAGPRIADVAHDLAGLLEKRNGFFAFESALHVLPSRPVPAGVMSVQAWNEPDLWRDAYDSAAEGCYFFAEDAFGSQFAMRDSRIVSFNPETGVVDQLTESLEDWAERLLEDYEVLTGFPVAHAWQEKNGRLPVDQRLLPKHPFVLGGPFTVENLHAVDAVHGMRFRAELAKQIGNLPDGTRVNLKLVD
jgi:hypothetical protein